MSQRPGTHMPAIRAETERALGITQRSAPFNFAWTGDIRKRYTDFLVNEIQRDGTVLHLRDYEEDEPSPPSQELIARKASQANLNKPENNQKVAEISEDDRKALVGLLGESVAEKLIKLDESVQAKNPPPSQERTVAFDPITDRSQRATVHQEIRRIFNSRIETVADPSGVITATPSKWSLNPRGAGGGFRRDGGRDNTRSRDQAREFKESGGDYLHFTLYKENKDTMDAVNTIARLLKIKASNFGFAGTKDRRAATVQRISVYRQKASNLIWLNSRIPNVKVGDFKYCKEPLQLGQHGGNEFIITLKNCQPLGGQDCSLAQRMQMIQQAVECGLSYLKHHGYINYYGLQRFGTYSIGTHLLGMKILKGDLEGFIDDILHVDDNLINEVFNNAPPAYVPGKDFQNNRDDYNRARAITTWKTTRNADKALEFLPKRFSSETAIIRHLGKNPKDLNGAVLSITRGMRMMYIHAYQSYVWNFVASRRWSKYGAKVVEGDLVLITDSRRNASPDEDFNPYDDYDEDDLYAQARALTAADVASGNYTIFDVVLPTPGYDVLYPRNDIGDFYAEFMGREENGGLDPYNMRRRQREFSLSGNYRHLIGRFIGDPQYAIRAYCEDTDQMYPTDLDYAHHKKAAERQAKAAARSARQPAVGRWLDFAKHPTTYDDAMAAERRRKAEQEPPSDLVLKTDETWVQTGLDGSAKRIKVAHHDQRVDNQQDNNPSRGSDSASAAPTLRVDGKSPGSDEDDDDDDSRPFPVGGGAPLTAGSQEDSPPRVITDGPIPMISIPKSAIPASGIRGVSDTYYASTGQIPYFGVLPADPNPQAAGNGDSVPQSKPQLLGALYPEATPQPSDTLGWYGTNLPKPAAGALEKQTKDTTNDSSTKGKEIAKVSREREVVNGVVVPQFRTASPNPLSSVGEATVDESDIPPNASKIAVILKFQLKQSNYATIVLRELMGATVDERAL